MTAATDIFIIGGGINGAGIARDAAGRGYSVTLCEKEDLASGTSNWSSKLVHGGVRYLEQYEFMLVRKALKEREVLWKAAPHIIQPMRFILPHHRGLRPAWFLRLGLFLYDHIGGRKLLPATKTVDLANGPYGKPLKGIFRKGFQYSDCQVDDARLVVLNAMDARERGAEILTRTECVEARRDNGIWHIRTRDTTSGVVTVHTARLLVNAAGPWVDKVLGQAFGRNDAHNVRLVQGSHIVVPKLFEHDNAYIFQNADGRIIFAIPWVRDTTLIGTTDKDFEGDPDDAAITSEEMTYLCDAASEYFDKPVTEDQILWTYAGVRPLYDDGATAAQEATRDYVLRKEGGFGEAALLNIFGGKITTFRELSDQVLEQVQDSLGAKGRPFTHKAALPGGDFDPRGFEALLQKMEKRYPFMKVGDLRRMLHAYGTRLEFVLGNATSQEELGEDFGHGLTEAEIRYLIFNEWARDAEDVLWRRSKLGLVFTPEQKQALDAWMRPEV